MPPGADEEDEGDEEEEEPEDAQKTEAKVVAKEIEKDDEEESSEEYSDANDEDYRGPGPRPRPIYKHIEPQVTPDVSKDKFIMGMMAEIDDEYNLLLLAEKARVTEYRATMTDAYYTQGMTI